MSPPANSIRTPSERADHLDPSVLAHVDAFRSELRARGFYERPLRPVLLAWVAHLVLAFGGIAACALSSSLIARAVAMLVSSFGFIGIGTVGHTASHGAASRSPTWNRIIYYASYPLLLLLSASYWTHSHVQTHHPAPNIVGLDDDCDLRPLFALNEEHQGTLGTWLRRWPVLQGVLLPLVLPFNGFNIIRQGWLQLFRELSDERRRGPAQWIDLACLVAHVCLFLILPCMIFPWHDVLLVYAAHVSITGMGLFAVLAPGHYPAEAACLARDQRGASDFYRRQGIATVNFRTGWLGRFLCSGLEYQIEHHFFPSVSHVHLRAMAPLVEQFCRHRGVPYRRLGWGEAVWKSWLVFFQPKPIVKDITSALSTVTRTRGEDLPLAAQELPDA